MKKNIQSHQRHERKGAAKVTHKDSLPLKKSVYRMNDLETNEQEEDLNDLKADNYIEGRHAVLEALRADRPVERLYVLDGCHDGPIETIRREAKKRNVQIRFSAKEALDRMSVTGRHQGVIAHTAVYHYAELSDIFALAENKNEKPFIFLLDNIEDPHNLGAIIRTANVCGAHGVIITKDRSAGLTPVVDRASAGALSHTPVVKVTNLTETIKELKDKGLWFVCADMDGEQMYKLDMRGAIGLVIGNEGTGVGALVRKTCDMVASIPMHGEIESLNASVAAGVLAYEVVRQRLTS